MNRALDNRILDKTGVLQFVQSLEVLARFGTLDHAPKAGKSNPALRVFGQLVFLDVPGSTAGHRIDQVRKNSAR